MGRLTRDFARLFHIVLVRLWEGALVCLWMTLACHGNIGPGNFGPPDQYFRWKDARFPPVMDLPLYSAVPRSTIADLGHSTYQLFAKAVNLGFATG